MVHTFISFLWSIVLAYLANLKKLDTDFQVGAYLHNNFFIFLSESGAPFVVALRATALIALR